MVAGDTESWAPGGLENQGFSVGSNGFQGFSADVAGKFSRESASAYVDLSVDVTERWLADAALRYERFSDFGSTTNGKLASRFDVAEGLAVRVAIGTGFRAPSIGQSSLRRAATVIVDGQLTESLTLPPTDPLAMLKGGRQLSPEESVHWGLGALFSLGPMDVTLDWFRIDVDGRIALTQQNLSAQDGMDLIAAGFVGAGTVTAVSFFVNDIETETTGLDLMAQTGLRLARRAAQPRSRKQRDAHKCHRPRRYAVACRRERTGRRPARQSRELHRRLRGEQLARLGSDEPLRRRVRALVQ